MLTQTGSRSAARQLRPDYASPSSLMGSGKSTFVKAIVAGEIQHVSNSCIIEPHSSSWFEIQVIGGKKDWKSVSKAIAYIVEEYTNRLILCGEHLTEHGEDRSITEFERIVVLFDEVNNAKSAYEITKKFTWSDFAKMLGSGVRNVVISVIFLSQSANV